MNISNIPPNRLNNYRKVKSKRENSNLRKNKEKGKFDEELHVAWKNELEQHGKIDFRT